MLPLIKAQASWMRIQLSALTKSLRLTCSQEKSCQEAVRTATHSQLQLLEAIFLELHNTEFNNRLFSQVPKSILSANTLVLNQATLIAVDMAVP